LTLVFPLLAQGMTGLFVNSCVERRSALIDSFLPPCR
jgi:hypothetical protein